MEYKKLIYHNKFIHIPDRRIGASIEGILALSFGLGIVSIGYIASHEIIGISLFIIFISIIISIVIFLLIFIYLFIGDMRLLSVGSINIYITKDNKLVIEAPILKKAINKSEYEEIRGDEYDKMKKYLSRKTFVFDLPLRIKKVKFKIPDSQLHNLFEKYEVSLGGNGIVGYFYVLGLGFYPGYVHDLVVSDNNAINQIKTEICDHNNDKILEDIIERFLGKDVKNDPKYSEKIPEAIALFKYGICVKGDDKIIADSLAYYINTFEGYLINDSYLIAGSEIANVINELLSYSTLEEARIENLDVNIQDLVKYGLFNEEDNSSIVERKKTTFLGSLRKILSSPSDIILLTISIELFIVGLIGALSEDLVEIIVGIVLIIFAAYTLYIFLFMRGLLKPMKRRKSF